MQVLLGRAQADGDKFRIDALSRVEKQTNKMAKLIQNLLDNAKLLEGKFDLVIERFNTHELLLEAVNDAQIISSTHEIVMKDCEEVFVLADRTKIAHVMENLISNAVSIPRLVPQLRLAARLLITRHKYPLPT